MTTRDFTDYGNEAPVHHIGWWYDRATRAWIIQRLDADLDQIGDAIYIGSGKADAKVEAQDLANHHRVYLERY